MKVQVRVKVKTRIKTVKRMKIQNLKVVLVKTITIVVPMEKNLQMMVLKQVILLLVILMKNQKVRNFQKDKRSKSRKCLKTKKKCWMVKLKKLS